MSTVMNVPVSAPTTLEKKFLEIKINKLEEAIAIIREKMNMHSSYLGIRHLLDKEKELQDMLHKAQQQYQK